MNPHRISQTLLISAALCGAICAGAAEAPDVQVDVQSAPGGTQVVFRPDAASNAPAPQLTPDTAGPMAPMGVMPAPQPAMSLMSLLQAAGGTREDPPVAVQSLEMEGRKLEMMIADAVAKGKGAERAQAKSDLSAIIQKYPGSVSTPQAKYELALLFIGEEKTDVLFARLGQVIADHPTSYWATEACLQIGKISTAAQQYEQALTAYRARLNRRPQAPDRGATELSAARCLQRLGRHQEAIQQSQAILSESPTPSLQAEARDCMTLSHIALGQYKEAVDQTEGVLRELPTYARLPILLLNEGLCLEELGRYGDAQRRYRDLLTRYGRSVEADSARLRLGDLTRPLLTVEAGLGPDAPGPALPAAAPGMTPPGIGVSDPSLDNTFRPN